MYQVLTYVTPDGRDKFRDWFVTLRDRRVSHAVERRLYRIEQGNFGDHKFCCDGVWELRIDLGPGFRIYYAHSGTSVVLLLCAGDKRTQQADIERASIYWKQFQEEYHESS